MMQLRMNKGTYGYFQRRKWMQTAKCLLVLLGMGILLAIGYHTTHTRKNMMTVIAIVSALPFSNAAVILFTVLPYHARPKEEYGAVKTLAGDGVFSTELLLTRSTGKNFLVDYAYVHPRGVFLYTTNAALQEKEAIAHIKEILAGHGLHTEIKIDKNLEQYQTHLKALEPVHRCDCAEELLKIEGVLHAISI